MCRVKLNWQDTPIDIYDGDKIILHTLCDIQPMSGALVQEEYGLEIERVKRIYTSVDKNIKEGMKVALNGEKPRYTIKYTEHWPDYTMALLAEIPQAAQDESVNVNTGENGASDIYGGGFY